MIKTPPLRLVHNAFGTAKCLRCGNEWRFVPGDEICECSCGATRAAVHDAIAGSFGGVTRFGVECLVREVRLGLPTVPSLEGAKRLVDAVKEHLPMGWIVECALEGEPTPLYAVFVDCFGERVTWRIP